MQQVLDTLQRSRLVGAEESRHLVVVEQSPRIQCNEQALDITHTQHRGSSKRSETRLSRLRSNDTTPKLLEKTEQLGPIFSAHRQECRISLHHITRKLQTLIAERRLQAVLLQHQILMLASREHDPTTQIVSTCIRNQVSSADASSLERPTKAPPAFWSL